MSLKELSEELDFKINYKISKGLKILVKSRFVLRLAILLLLVRIHF